MSSALHASMRSLLTASTQHLARLRRAAATESGGESIRAVGRGGPPISALDARPFDFEFKGVPVTMLLTTGPARVRRRNRWKWSSFSGCSTASWSSSRRMCS